MYTRKLIGGRSALVSLLVLVVSIGVVMFTSAASYETLVSPPDDPDIHSGNPLPVADVLTRPVDRVSTPVASPPAPISTPLPGPASARKTMLNADELGEYQPNELGVVPILEYHVITTDPEEEAQFVRLADDMRADLQWLYEHDFHIVPLRDVIQNTIEVPAGKHPVALTFDDAQSSQFSFVLDAEGELVLDENGDPVPEPDTAVGILEAFYEAHPDFGRGGHFAPLVFNAFANPDKSQEPYFEDKLHWLIERGYEVGNHTKQHNDLTDIETDEFIEAVAEPIVFMDDVLGDIPENQSLILTLPFGSTPDGDLHPDQRKMMREGIPYKGELYPLSGALLVGAEPAVPPASTHWDPMWIPRIQMFDESVDFWFDQFENGGVILYTSDGNPDTIVVPDALPSSLEGTLDTDGLAEADKTVIHYDPETGEIMNVRGESLAMIIGDQQRRASRPAWRMALGIRS